MALIFGLVVILTTNLLAHSQENHALPEPLPSLFKPEALSQENISKNSAEITEIPQSEDNIFLNTTATTSTDSSPSYDSLPDSSVSIIPVSFTNLPSKETVATTHSPNNFASSPAGIDASPTMTTLGSSTEPTTLPATVSAPSSEPRTDSPLPTTLFASSSEAPTDAAQPTTQPPSTSAINNSTTVEPAVITTTTSQPTSTSVPPKQHHPAVSVALTLFILLTVILTIGIGVWWIRRRRQLERLRHQLMPMYNFDPTDDGDDWENQLLEEERSLRPEAEKVQLYSGNSTFDSSQKPSNNSIQKE